jgi:NAD(P)-dependent dehydrogenase (short-subunit alcohol dehydrogenase family)
MTMLIDKTYVARDALKGSVAVVTGAGQGIGLAAARVLAHIGAAVVIAEINDTGLEAERLVRSEGGRALFVRTDVSDPASMVQLQERASEAFGAVDILVNNAEAFKAGRILDCSIEAWDRIMAVNLRGAFLGIKAFLPGMLERQRGVIITMQSADAMPYLVPYIASKVGLRSIAASLATEVGESSGVSIFCFGPGMVDTPGANKAFVQLAPLFGMSLDEFIKMASPDGKLADPEVVATGLAGTILYAKDFHGEETIYTAGLAKLGLTSTGDLAPSDAASAAPARTVATAQTKAATTSTLQHALELNRRFEDIVRANIKEYDELSVFMRQWVKRDFQQRSGLKVEDWLTKAQAMTRRLEAAQSPTGAVPVPPAEIAAYCTGLDRMEAFIIKQEGDARGWVKEPDKLIVALAALAERKSVVQTLAATLRSISV